MASIAAVVGSWIPPGDRVLFVGDRAEQLSRSIAHVRPSSTWTADVLHPRLDGEVFDTVLVDASQSAGDAGAVGRWAARLAQLTPVGGAAIVLGGSLLDAVGWTGVCVPLGVPGEILPLPGECSSRCVAVLCERDFRLEATRSRRLGFTTVMRLRRVGESPVIHDRPADRSSLRH